MQDQGGSTVSFSPSFNCYSSNKLADIAAKVGREEQGSIDRDRDIVCTNRNDDVSVYGSSDEDDDDDFEFVLVRANPDGCFTIDRSDYPVFPLFDRDLLLDSGDKKESQDDDDLTSEIRLPLNKLFIDDPSSSLSEVDELDRIVPGTYCVWTPPQSRSPSPSPSPSRCKKSNSTGSSSKHRWWLRDFLHLRRCSSGGKESYVFMNPDHNNKKKEKIDKGKTSPAAKAGKGKAKEKTSAHEVFYVRNKALKEGDKRKSYLPYRRGLVGFFANVNGLGKAFPPL
ncbi:hypothetical protein JCGZ_09585 [Jatropha curcas]|uniref:Uncharacterized protein n=1 Tax=Jatropha curcas TaxID=180498 RepID=A0A067LA54_JATCU|nr:uncharacterized protein LOC105641515 [Jatropha curcas]KDP45336.1 hypothetical protein JCGZ_09585 [Jatropha curcas]